VTRAAGSASGRTECRVRVMAGSHRDGVRSELRTRVIASMAGSHRGGMECCVRMWWPVAIGFRSGHGSVGLGVVLGDCY